ncbi:NADP-dependent malic enzyme [Streptomyces sp. NPDC059340]|uniref:NAD(P)-dependent malic enzyme n=1 Tax=Streptomyces sp. NPDC059340 TaxID=3346806 RepID=UPI00368C9EFA
MNAESATSAERPEAVGRDSKPVFALHRRGKMAITSTVPLRDSDDLSLAYTPGVAEVCTAIAEQPELVHDYTWASHTVAVVTDGSHDDQHGTAIVTLAALRNAARLTGRDLADLRAVVSGAGAAAIAIAIAKILIEAGIGDIAVADRTGIIHRGRTDLTDVKRDLAVTTNRAGLAGTLQDALAGADVFIGVSGGTVPETAVATMARGAFIFAMANPTPEIHPDIARSYAAVVSTGRSDYPNQINNVLAFPGIFAGALRVRASRITPGMKLAAADALASVVADELRPDHIIPTPFDPRVAPAVAEAVATAGRLEGATRR